MTKHVTMCDQENQRYCGANHANITMYYCTSMISLKYKLLKKFFCYRETVAGVVKNFQNNEIWVTMCDQENQRYCGANHANITMYYCTSMISLKYKLLKKFFCYRETVAGVVKNFQNNEIWMTHSLKTIYIICIY